MATTQVSKDSDIYADMFAPFDDDLPTEAAKALLKLKLTTSAKRRISRLLARNNRGTISPEDRSELEDIVRMGTLLDLIHAKSRQLLKKSGEALP